MAKQQPAPEPQPLNPDDRERIETVKAVVKAGGPEATRMLAQALADPVEGFRQMIADSLITVGSSALPTLSDLITDPNPDVRRWSAGVMGRLNNSQAVGPLLFRLTDADAGVRAAAAEALGNLGDKRGVDPLVWMSANDRDERCRASATWALRMIGAVMLHAHLPLLNSPDFETRMRARDTVAAKGKAVALAVADLLKDQDPVMRTTAAEILGTLADERTLDALIEAMGDKELPVRTAVVQALSSMRSEKAAQVLVGQLVNADPHIVSEAGAALVGQGNIAVPALLGLLRQENTDLRSLGIELLGRLHDTRATEPLLAIVEGGDPGLRMMAIRALGAIRDKSAAPRLLPLLKDPSDNVRAAAADALGMIAAPEALPLILPMLEIGDVELRVKAARAIGRIGDPKAFSALVEVMDSTEPELRAAAIEALGQLRDKRVVPFLKKIVRPWPLSTEPESVKTAARVALARLLKPAAK